MRSKFFFILTLLLLPVFSYGSFNIVDRLASPFVDDTGYSSSYSSDSDDKDSNSDSSKWIIILFMVIAILFLPAETKYSARRKRMMGEPLNPSLASTLGDAILGLASKKIEKKYYEFDDNEIIKKENEIKELLPQTDLTYEKIIEHCKYAFEQFILFQQGEKNDISRISTESFYTKYLKPISELYDKAIKNIISDFRIEDIKIVNLRYTEYEKAFSVMVKYFSRQYYADAINKNFISGDRTPISRYVFLTFIFDDGWKLSLIERKGESYVMRIENAVKNYPQSSKKEDIPVSGINLRQDNIKKISLQQAQLKIAEYFFNLYTWWQKPDSAIKLDISDELKQKLISAREKITTDPTVSFQINKIIISGIDFLNIDRDLSQNIKRIIARIKFSIKGKFLKNGIMLLDETERLADEIWEFKLDGEKIMLYDIPKRINSSNQIESNPLQIEWHI
ncbi:MAG: hypothetical protein GX445_02570 [Elusimicrobia bacterium]|nr:hypothetical protein [Elusimicrobiota bacterium]